MTLFTAEEAIEVAGTADAYLVTPRWAIRQMERHDIPAIDQMTFFAENKINPAVIYDCVDAGQLLIWLGY